MTDTTEINLLGKSYRVACAAEEREALVAAVALLDDKLRNIGEKTRSKGERLAVMTALNLAHELLARQAAIPAPADALANEPVRRRIASVEAKLDAALAEHEQLF
ncbi:MAG: cell division protein ZapA [Betaproteobacteria bacterium HGW-Betaproteobacteria-11]|nr:MAG: cell division protein ZapA [Betaproteobacteria bacterium HGW-Betaproteobacteria-11]